MKSQKRIQSKLEANVIEYWKKKKGLEQNQKEDAKKHIFFNAHVPTNSN